MLIAQKGQKLFMQKKQEIVRIPINQIYPDPDQPRKRLPKDLTLAVKEEMNARALLKELRSRAETQNGLASFLNGLDDLAISIKQVGQLAPIRVYPDERRRYVIEMGERRWLAHLILHIERGDSDYSHIDAIIAPKPATATAQQQTLQRRMAENVQRAEFSPIEMARGLADRIAQVLEENAEMKRGKAEDCVGEENGITGRRVRQFLSLLTLCDDALKLAQEAGLTERALRGVLKFKEPEGQMQAVRKFITGQREKAKSSRATDTPEKWADMFLSSALTIGRSKDQVKPYKRALRSCLKRNPRARAFLNHLLQSNRLVNGNGKHAVSSDASGISRRRRVQNARRRRKDGTFEFARTHDRDNRPGRHRKK
ncbi:MAG: ParB N-terminal domain-containing protein [Anaerolineae bacterium]|nr:ParB N-terminal domain-containing protein [Anaerolineae bacterium]